MTYYARVIEIPTPRWTAYEALRFGITMTDDVPMTTQERAYTSPRWYTPDLVHTIATESLRLPTLLASRSATISLRTASCWPIKTWPPRS